VHWAVSFVGRGRSERVATEQQVLARLALEQAPDDFVTLGQEPRQPVER
jgi:NADH dehydrogenase